MANFKECNECGEYHWDDKNCAPIYKIYHEDYLGDDFKVVRAYSHDAASEHYAEYYNVNCDYCLMNKTIDIEVEDTGGLRKKIRVGASPSVEYNSTEI